MFQPTIQFERDNENLENIIFVNASVPEEPKETVIGHIIQGKHGGTWRIFGTSEFFGSIPSEFGTRQDAENAVLRIRSHWGIWYDNSVPVPGVADVPQGVYDDLCYGDSIDENYIAFLEENGIPFRFSGMIVEILEDSPDWKPEFDVILDSLEFGELGNGTQLVGDWYYNQETKVFDPLPDALRTENSLGYTGIVYEGGTMHIVQSDYVERSALCSPCYPGSADLGTPGDTLAYTLPTDYFSEQWNHWGKPDQDRLTVQFDIPSPIGSLVPVISKGDVIDRELGTVERYRQDPWDPYQSVKVDNLGEYLGTLGDLWIFTGDTMIAKLITILGVFCLGTEEPDPEFRALYAKYTAQEYRFPM